jgi:protein TonB
MRTAHSPRPPAHDAYSIEEIAAAARVPYQRVVQALRVGQVAVFGTTVPGPNAIALVKSLRRGSTKRLHDMPLSLPVQTRRKQGLPLAISIAAHALFVALLLTASVLGLLNGDDTEQQIEDQTPVRLVYFAMPGPGGGGGGGGLKAPIPAPKAERKAVVKKKVSSPVPPPAKRPVPPRPEPPKPVPAPPPPVPVPVVQTAPPIPVPAAPPAPAPPPAVIAPVASIAADANNRVGVAAESPNQSPSSGPGNGGGAGSGTGTGLGEGQGAGIGPGSGGGIGGGPFRPGSGIAPPQLLREVRANYTDDARRRAIEGDVVLEIVVRRDGTIGNVRVLHTLGAGLEQKAIDAVRQWRFSPATRSGSAVDVIVEVAVEFKLR